MVTKVKKRKRYIHWIPIWNDGQLAACGREIINPNNCSRLLTTCPKCKIEMRKSNAQETSPEI